MTFKNFMYKGVLMIAVLALIGWLGYSAYDIYESGKERTVSEVNYDAVSDFGQRHAGYTDKSSKERN